MARIINHGDPGIVARLRDQLIDAAKSIVLYKALIKSDRSGLLFSPWRDLVYTDYLPENNQPGRWTPRGVRNPVVCAAGWHLTDRPNHWIERDFPLSAKNWVVFVAEGSGAYDIHEEKIAFESIRLVRQVDRDGLP